MNAELPRPASVQGMPMGERREIRALVTGAAGGMGRATCLELLRDTRRRGQTLRLAAAGAGARGGGGPPPGAPPGGRGAPPGARPPPPAW